MKRTKEYIEWRNSVVERDGECVVCGALPPFLNAHHLIPSNFKEFSLEKNNGITLCPHHHTLGKWSAHKNPLWFTNWLKDNRPKAYERSMSHLDKLELKNIDHTLKNTLIHSDIKYEV